MVHKHMAEFILRAWEKLRPFDLGTSLVSLFQRNDPKLGYKCSGMEMLKAISLHREQFELTCAAIRHKCITGGPFIAILPIHYHHECKEHVLTTDEMLLQKLAGETKRSKNVNSYS